MAFQINKKKTVEAFREYAKKFDRPQDDYHPQHAKKLVTPTKYFVLDRIRSLYQWVLENSVLELRHHFIHNDDEFKLAKGQAENFIRNKVRSQSDGNIYMKVKDITFDGSQEQYKAWIVQNKTKLLSVIRKIVDDLNGFFEGEVDEDSNKPVLNGSLYEEVEVEEPVEEVVETPEPVVEEKEEIFIKMELSLKSLMEEINNETSD